MADETNWNPPIGNPPTDELAREADRRSTRAWHHRLTASFKRLAEDPEYLASIEKRSF